MTGIPIIKPDEPGSFPVVGIGASAGGLAAFTQFLKSLPAEPGVACVLIQHLDPNYPSELAHILGSATTLSVTTAEEGEVLQPDHIYVLPPDALLTIAGGQFHLEPRTEGHPFAIDHFLISLAAARGLDSIGVVLSGSGSDGTEGLRAVKAAGGTTFAQDPASAEHGDMPRAAIASGAVDHVLFADAIARAILDPAMRRSAPSGDGSANPDQAAAERDAFDRIKELLYDATGVDFRHYKTPVLQRRIQRRLAHRRAGGFAEYLELLRRDSGETAALYREVLLHVTGFFRDPDALAALKHHVLPELMANRSAATPLRIWVPGCASGEEAYSIGICALEVKQVAGLPIQIFATDLSEEMLETARRGVYPSAIGTEVSPERLERFFIPSGTNFQVTKSLRDLCMFSRHDLTEDPPFSRLDLISCRNVLIYFDPVLQARALHMFHYSLKPGGALMLGPAESIEAPGNLFSIRDRAARIYLRGPGPSRLPSVGGVVAAARIGGPAAQRPAPSGPDTLTEAVDAVALQELSMPGVVVNSALEVVQFRGRTNPYLSLPEGQPSANLLKLAHPELRVPLGRMLRKARKDRRRAGVEGVTFQDGDRERVVNLHILPVPFGASEDPCFLVVFQGGDRKRRVAARPDGPVPVDPTIDELQTELTETRDYLQSLIDEQDRVHAELQAAHEDSLSINEEFQSTNEELVTTKEEVQSVNEELTTVNDEMRKRNVELQNLNTDLANVLESVRIPIIICDRDLRLRRYSPSADRLFGLSRLPDRSRLTDAPLPIAAASLDRLCRAALENDRPETEQVRDGEGRWHEVRSWPYRNAEGRTVGVVFALVDIDELHRATAAAGRARDRSASIVEAVAHPLVVLDRALHIREANRQFDETFPVLAGEAEGAVLSERVGGLWNAPSFHDRLTGLLQSGQGFQDLELPGYLEGRGRRVFRVSGRQLAQVESESADILLAVEDVTARRLLDQRLHDAAKMQATGQIAGGVAHEINNQMQGVLGFSSQLLKNMDPDDPRKGDLEQIVKAGLRAAEVTKNLLAYSRRQKLRPESLILDDVIRDITPFVRQIFGPGIALEVSPSAGRGRVHAERTALEQIMVNLALNARDAMPDGGRVSIETALVKLDDGESARRGVSVQPGSYLRVMFRDTGRGMDRATLERVFEPFFTTKEVGEGTGLGLASTYGTVKQCGGYIWIESSPGQGTEVTIDLPRVAEGKASGPEVVPDAPPPHGSETVLVVDDEEPIRAWICRVLKTLGYAALAAANGAEALALIEGGAAVDLLVTDVALPGMGGEELGERANGLLPGLPVLFTSGFPRDEIVGREQLDPHARLLLKPFTAAQVAIEVRTLLDAARKQPVS